MNPLYARVKLFFKSIWNGMLGIGFEVIFVYLFISIGVLTCLFWWSLLIR